MSGKAAAFKGRIGEEYYCAYTSDFTSADTRIKVSSEVFDLAPEASKTSRPSAVVELPRGAYVLDIGLSFAPSITTGSALIISALPTDHCLLAVCGHARGPRVANVIDTISNYLTGGQSSASATLDISLLRAWDLRQQTQFSTAGVSVGGVRLTTRFIYVLAVFSGVTIAQNSTVNLECWFRRAY